MTREANTPAITITERTTPVGNYGRTLPATGGLVIGGAAIGYPWIAAAAAALVVAGFLLLRFVKPAQTHQQP